MIASARVLEVIEKKVTGTKIVGKMMMIIMTL